MCTAQFSNLFVTCTNKHLTHQRSDEGNVLNQSVCLFSGVLSPHQHLQPQHPLTTWGPHHTGTPWTCSNLFNLDPIIQGDS